MLQFVRLRNKHFAFITFMGMVSSMAQTKFLVIIIWCGATELFEFVVDVVVLTFRFAFLMALNCEPLVPFVDWDVALSPFSKLFAGA